MVYKRYIKRGGKVYGPYVYHSRKVNGKVISEYHGTSKKVDRKKKQKALINSLKFVGIILFSLFLIYLAFFITKERLDLVDIHQDGVATASSKFDIKSRTLTLLEIFGAILFLAIIILLIILLFIVRKRKSFIIRPYK